MNLSMRLLLIVVAILVATAVGRPAMAASACDTATQGLSAVYCEIPPLQQADRALNQRYAQLFAHLTAPRRAALKTDELAWLKQRDQACTQQEGDRLFVDLVCATTMTGAHAAFLAGRYRRCVLSRCSDLDFYNTQDGDVTDSGPTLRKYKSISRYHGSDAGYIAVYSHDDRDALYSVGGGIFVAGFIRLRGAYDGRIFQPMGYRGADISANRDFKALTNALFPGHDQGTWAGGDTGGFVEP
jgi:uncharacterized protein YecT (DUF1311 family)